MVISSSRDSWEKTPPEFTACSCKEKVDRRAIDYQGLFSKKGSNTLHIGCLSSFTGNLPWSPAGASDVRSSGRGPLSRPDPASKNLMFYDPGVRPPTLGGEAIIRQMEKPCPPAASLEITGDLR